MNNDFADKASFIATFGGIYEKSPWVAEEVWGTVSPSADSRALHGAMKALVDRASRDRKLALLRAHPDLVGRFTAEAALTDDSRFEQASAGLDRCSPEEADELAKLNAAYRSRFGFPFILAVRGKTLRDILASLRARLSNSPEAEFQTALEEVHKIALLRLDARRSAAAPDRRIG